MSMIDENPGERRVEGEITAPKKAMREIKGKGVGERAKCIGKREGEPFCHT